MTGGEPTLGEFFAAWELFQHAALSGALGGAVLGTIGVYVVLRRMVFLSAAAAQTAGLGVASALYLQHLGVSAALAAPSVGATVVTLVALWLVLDTDRGQTTSARRDSRLGLVFLLGAAGTVALGTKIPQELHDIEALLFGTAVAVVPGDFHELLSVAVVVLGLHVWLWRGFAAASFDHDGAVVRGLPVRALGVLLYVTLAVALGTSTRVLGALPTFAFSVLPAMAVLRFAPNVPTALIAACFVGAAQGFVGYLVAFLLELPVGACQTLVGIAIWAAVAAVTRRR